MRGDIIETYKILSRLFRVDAGKMFSLAVESRMRGVTDSDYRARDLGLRCGEVFIHTDGGDVVEFATTKDSAGQAIDLF